MITNRNLNKWIGISISIICFCLVLFLLYQPSIEASASVEVPLYEEKLFNQNQVSIIDIQIDQAQWDSMIENALTENYVKCNLVINGETYYNVGIRAKGNSSLSQVASDPDTDRVSFKVKFDKYVKGQNYYGLDKFVLNNNFMDATSMKEYLSYEIMDYIGVTNPLHAYSQITVNGEPWGLYLAVEAVEKSFAERNFGSDYGQLYKPESTEMGGGGKGDVSKMERLNGQRPMDNGVAVPEGALAPKSNGEVMSKDSQVPMSNGAAMWPDFNEMPKGSRGFGESGGGSDLIYSDDRVDSYSNIFDSAVFKTTSEDKERVIIALKNLNEGSNLEKYIDVDSVLKYFAANTFVVNLDSYVSNMKHNYYLYEKDGQLSMLPWDYNLAFGGFQTGTASSAVNFPIDTPVSEIDLSERPIIGKLLEIEAYQAKYYEYLRQIAEEYVGDGLYAKAIKDVQSLISPYVKEDPTAFYSYDEYIEAIATLKQFGLLRAESIKGQLNGSIPSTTQAQKEKSHLLVDGSSINLEVMGTQGGGMDKGNRLLAIPMDGEGNNKANQSPEYMQDGSSMSNRTAHKASGSAIVINAIALIVLLCALAYIWTFKKRKR